MHWENEIKFCIQIYLKLPDTNQNLVSLLSNVLLSVTFRLRINKHSIPAPPRAAICFFKLTTQWHSKHIIKAILLMHHHLPQLVRKGWSWFTLASALLTGWVLLGPDFKYLVKPYLARVCWEFFALAFAQSNRFPYLEPQQFRHKRVQQSLSQSFFEVAVAVVFEWCACPLITKQLEQGFHYAGLYWDVLCVAPIYGQI